MCKSHVVPKAFLQRSTHAPFMAWSGTGRPKRMYDGWYDHGILTDEGEKYFDGPDDVAAKCFAGKGFTYRSRRDPLDINKLQGGFEPNSVYAASEVDVPQIRLFALSMLWRAAISNQDAFSSVRVSPSHLSDLKARILRRDAGPATEYPVYFGVFCDTVELPKVSPTRIRNHPFYRFFLDGVVCYVSPTRRNKWSDNLGLLLVGSEADTIRIFCFSSIDSEHEAYTREENYNLRSKYGNIFSGLKKDANRRR